MRLHFEFFNLNPYTVHYVKSFSIATLVIIPLFTNQNKDQNKTTNELF